MTSKQEENDVAMTCPEDIQLVEKVDASVSDQFMYRPLKSQQKKIEFPDMKLHIGSMEINFMLSAHETIISQFRLNKRYIEKELANLLNQTKKMKKMGKDKPDVTVEAIDSMLQQIDIVKSDYLKMTKIEDELINILEQRLNHLKKVSKNIKDPVVLQEYFETRLNRAIVDYMLQNKHFQSAESFVSETNIQVFSDIHIYVQINTIFQSLKKLSNKTTDSNEIIDALDQALNWCNTYKTKLQKSGSQLEFNLRLLQFVEKVKKSEIMEATKYAQTHLRKFFDSDQGRGSNSYQSREQISLIFQAMGLLALVPSERHKAPTYKYFTNEQRWIEIQELFLEEANKLFHLSKVPMIENSLQVGLSSIKTVFCNQSQVNQSQDVEMESNPFASLFGEQNNNLFGSTVPTEKEVQKQSQAVLNAKTRHLESQCPACDPLMLKLGQRLKYAQQSQTNMKCKISGKVMNDQDPPMWVPMKKHELTEKQKEEMKKNSSSSVLSAKLIDQKINKGYLISKSTLESLEEFSADPKDLDTRKSDPTPFSLTARTSDAKNKKCVFKCPLTGDLVEVSKVRKVYFC